jgi:hypothetical protein
VPLTDPIQNLTALHFKWSKGKLKPKFDLKSAIAHGAMAFESALTSIIYLKIASDFHQ